jgi:hypothetical protein
MMKTKWKKETLEMRVESPTWGDVKRMAEVVIERLGGQGGAAQGLSWESYYTLTLLASLNLDEEKAAAYLFGKQYISG